ncbi:TonB-dependent receptor [Segetibacter sp. 3557_3]|uniref:outer membrane beta-barrel protein n=1 Tax=Segetibacter sp. 3557_3 TaxID=2547429 RepID=UPI001058B94E|nr:outer membrane beta-barrel protein [Segetibacter sp. 3557_3]TDH25223.1 TonB-dependent receptor [Segetibacter sp. 3557_3]
MRSCFFLFCLFITAPLFSQGSAGTMVSITVSNVPGKALEGATIILFSGKDSLPIKTEISDQSGIARFENIAVGEYYIKATMVQYRAYQSKAFKVNQSAVSINVILNELDIKNLDEVTVTAKKPFIQKLTDRIVVNVENSIVNAGSTALEVLERSPGVTVDQNDNISLRGKSGVIVMVDGKVTPMTGADLAGYLRVLPSNAIERIDIITNPSSKYDAAGNAGIIDIRLKKDQRLGTNGTLTAGYGQGVYPKANSGVSLNYRNKKVNVLGSYNYSYRKGLNHLLLERNFFRNGQFVGGDEKDNFTRIPTHTSVARMGADFSPNKNTIVGFVVSGTYNNSKTTNNNNSIVVDNTKQAANTFTTGLLNNNRFGNTLVNINFRHTFDTTGKELTADADYGVFTSRSRAGTTTRYFFLDGTPQKPTYILQGDQDGRLTIKTAKADYVNPLATGAKIEAGIKTSFVSSDNDARFFDISTSISQVDTTKTNRFKYNENNNAAYINYSKDYKKFSLQLGLRGEATNINTLQEKGNTAYDSAYFQLFPSAFLNYKLSLDKTLGLSISRRIDRPGYAQLNPFLFLIDVSTYSTGKPGLLPQLTWSYEMSYTLKQLNFTLGYSHTRDNQNIVIVPFKDVFPLIPLTDTNVTVQVPVNLESFDYYGLTISAPVRFSKWWNLLTNANLFYNNFKGNLANTPLNNGTPAANITANNTFVVGKGWTTELNLSYNSRVRSGYMIFRPQYGVSAGVQKTLGKNGTLRLNITDIFWTNLPRATITYTNYIENWRAYRETRVANLSFTYRFGNNKVAAARRRTTASEEERRRAGGN